eukprot:scaffold1697_cov180-Amphora_coffeaeformis.AAC.19
MDGDHVVKSQKEVRKKTPMGVGRAEKKSLTDPTPTHEDAVEMEMPGGQRVTSHTNFRSIDRRSSSLLVLKTGPTS